MAGYGETAIMNDLSGKAVAPPRIEISGVGKRYAAWRGVDR